MDNLISMLCYDGPLLGLIMAIIKDKIVVKWCDLRGALIFEPCTGETYEEVELGQKLRIDGQQVYREGN